MRPTTQLRDYQRYAERFISTRKRGQLWLDVGLGKTAALASALSAGYRRTKNIRTLVFATRAIAQTVWTEELTQWEHLAWLAPHARSLVGLSPAAREKAIFTDSHSRLDTLNYEQVLWLAAKLEERGMSLGQLYDTVVCDEITKLKNPSGKWFRTMTKLVHPDHVPYFWGLTGSPASEGYAQVWAPMFLVDYGYRLGYTYQQYLDRFFVSVGDRFYTKQGGREQIHNLLKDVVLSLNASDYAVLPDVIHNPRMLPMPNGALRRQYDVLERDMFLELEKGDVIASNAGVLVGKCLQFTSGALYMADELGAPSRQWQRVHELKLDALSDLVDELAGRPLLVAVQFKHELTRIKERFPHAVHMNSHNVVEVSKRWNAKQIPMLLAHPNSCGHGLNLQHGGGDVCFYSPPYSLEQFEQVPGRLARPGQEHPTVVVHMLLMQDTVDQYGAWEALRSKQTLQQTLKRAMSARG